MLTKNLVKSSVTFKRWDGVKDKYVKYVNT